MIDSSFLNSHFQSTLHPEAHRTIKNIPHTHRTKDIYVTGVKFKHLKYRKLKQSAYKLQC